METLVAWTFAHYAAIFLKGFERDDISLKFVRGETELHNLGTL